MESKELVAWPALPWESARALDLCLCCRGASRREIIIKQQLNAPLILLWMRAARCSTSFMLCWFHGGINTTLSQHPVQPPQPRCTASTADYLILCLLTHLSLQTNTAAKVGRGLLGDVTRTQSAMMEVPDASSMVVQNSRLRDRKAHTSCTYIMCDPAKRAARLASIHLRDDFHGISRKYANESAN